MTVKPYESEADLALRAKADEERRKREEEAKGANDKYRALEVPLGKALGGLGGEGVVILVQKRMLTSF